MPSTIGQWLQSILSEVNQVHNDVTRTERRRYLFEDFRN